MPSQSFISGAVKSVCFNEHGLTIELRSGNRYRYADARCDEYIKLCNAAKRMTYYNKNIKHIYESRKLEQHQA